MCRWCGSLKRRAQSHRFDLRQPDAVRADGGFRFLPRTWKADVAKLAAEKVDLIWNPDVKAMYPDGFAT